MNTPNESKMLYVGGLTKENDQGGSVGNVIEITEKELRVIFWGILRNIYN